MVDKFKSWWQDGLDYSEFLGLCIVIIFGYLVFYACRKMMTVGLVELDIEFLKIISTNIIIILCFYFGGNSTENIIESLFYKEKFKDKHEKNSD